MIKDFNVNITRLTAGVSQKGFGLVLIAHTGATSGQAGFGYRKYTSLADLQVDYAIGTAPSNMATTLFAQNPKPVEVAVISTEGSDSTALTTMLNSVADEDFFGIVITNNALFATVASFADSTNRVAAVTLENATATSTSDNLIIGYHNNIDDKNYVAEALLMHLLLKVIGSTTGKARRLQSIEPATVTSATLNALNDNNAVTYIEKYGVNQTTEGKVASGEYIDVILGAYFIQFRIEEGLAALLVNTPKIPYSDEGISQLVSVVDAVLKRAVAQDIILRDENGNGVYNIEFESRSESPTNDIANRVYNGISWEAVLSGAIHEGTINGVLTL